MSKILLNPGPTNTKFKTKLAQWKGSDICHREKKFQKILEETKQLLLKRLGDTNDFNIALMGGSGTLAIEAMISSLIKECTIINAGNYGERAIEIMKIYGIKYNEIKAHTIYDLKRDESIKHLYFVENETTTGEKFRLDDMSYLYPNAKFYIDAVSAFNASIYDFYFDRINALSTCSNKCLQSTPGIAIVFWKKNIPIYNKSFYSNLNYYRYQMPFTMPTQSIYALNKTLKITGNNYYLFESRKNKLIYDLNKININCINQHPSNCIIGFKHHTITYEGLHNYLNKKGIIIYSKIPNIDNSFRISVISTKFDKKYNKIIGAIHDYCLH